MMKNIKIICVALVVGIVCAGTGFFKVESVPVSRIVLFNAFNGIEYYPQYISQFTYQYIPLFAFQIIFATHIYKHFCCASVYFFSRNINRIKWFSGEVLRLYVYAVMYLTVVSIAQIVVISMFSKIVLDNTTFIILFYYIVIYSLYLLFTTLAINILSITFSSNIGFIIVQGIILLAISTYFYLGNYIKDDIITKKAVLFIKSNIIANLVFSIHSSNINKLNALINTVGINFDMNFSIIYYMIICIVVIVFGAYVVEKYEFITNSKEM